MSARPGTPWEQGEAFDQRHVTTPADLLAFMDAQRATVGPPIRPDGSGWIIAFDADAHVATAWDKSGVKLERRCATLTEALELIRRYEHGLPL